MAETMNRISRIGTVCAVATALAVAFAGTSVQASTIDATNLDEIDLDAQNLVHGPETTEWRTAVHQSFAGELTAEVYEDNGLFTYTYETTPEFHYWRSVTSPTNLAGVDEDATAGYSFSEADAAGEEFNILFNEEAGSLQWQIPDADTRLSNWRADETITFFYQSGLEPADVGTFGSAWDGAAAEAQGVVPIPEPATASLLGLLSLAMLRRRRSRGL